MRGRSIRGQIAIGPLRIDGKRFPNSLTMTNRAAAFIGIGTMTLSARITFLLSSSASLLLGLGCTAMSQTAAPGGSGTIALPKVEVIAPRRVQHFNLAACSCRVREFDVGRQQRNRERLGKRNVSGVVGCEVVAQLPAARQQVAVR